VLIKNGNNELLKSLSKSRKVDLRNFTYEMIVTGKRDLIDRASEGHELSEYILRFIGLFSGDPEAIPKYFSSNPDYLLEVSQAMALHGSIEFFKTAQALGKRWKDWRVPSRAALGATWIY
jgi:hypothetical protein